MTAPELDENSELTVPALSKRAARRAIQRAFVLVGREKAIRQHLREVEFTTLWVLDDWGLDWTVVADHGRLEFHRGRAGRAEITLVWPTAEAFFDQVVSGLAQNDSFEFSGDVASRRLLDPLLKSFTSSLRQVLANPIDDDGERLW